MYNREKVRKSLDTKTKKIKAEPTPSVKTKNPIYSNLPLNEQIVWVLRNKNHTIKETSQLPQPKTMHTSQDRT